MLLRRSKLQAYRLSAICDSCKKGELKNDGTVLLSSPPQYPHICVKCGKQENLWDKYPTIEYETS